nr:ESPR-type extended signal peptide-containing protein [uncultured Dialister sp.]
MNRVYKVIWSKAKHCYVVTSEIAKSVTKSASSARSAGRKGAAVLALAALLFTAGGVLGEAANVTDVSGSIEAKNLIIVTKDDGNSTNFSINDVAHAKDADYATEATKATSDGNGEVIHKIYAKKEDVEKNLSDLDKRINANTEAVIKVGQQAGENFTDLYAKVQTNADAVAAETAARKTADQNNLKVGDDGVISKVSNDGTTPSAVKTLVLKVDGDNQITMDEKGIKVGLNSGVMDKDGFYAGGDDYEHAGAALKWDGSIKGADGKFTVDKDGNADIGGDLTVDKNLTVNGTFDSETLSSTVVPNINYTTINGGNVKSEVNDKVGTVDYSAESIFNKEGSSITVRTDEGIVDSTGKSIVGAKEISQYLGNNAVPDGSDKNVTRKMVRNDDGTFRLEDKAVDGAKSSTVNQTETGIKSTATDGKNTASTNLSNGGFNTYATDGTNKTYTKQTAMDIENTAKNGTISNTAKGLVNTASENMTNNVGKNLETTVGGEMKTTVTGKVTEDFKNDLTTIIGRNKSETVAGTSEETVTGKKTETYGGLETTVNGEEKHTVNGSQTNGITGNQTNTIGGEMKTTVTGKVTEDYKSDLDTKVGGNETHYVKGNQTNTVSGDRTVNVKGTETENFNAQVTNIKTDQTTSVGGNQTNIVASNQQNIVSGSKTETVKGSVTEKYGSQATTVDGDQRTNVGGSQFNVVAGNQTNTISGSKTETVKGAVTETYGSQTTKVNGDQSTTVTGKQTNSITGDQVNTIGGNQTTTVTGDSSLSAKNITNTAEGGTIYNKSKDILNEASGDILNFADGEIGNVATKITNITGDNTVTSDTDGTTFVNTGANTPMADGNEHGSRTDTKIKGNTVETGKVMTDFADVNNNLTVGGSTTLGRDGNTNLTVNSKSTFRDTVKMEKTLEVDGESTFNNKVTITKGGLDVKGGTTTDTLTVTGDSEFVGRADFRDNVFMDENLTVAKETRTGTLYVNNDGYVDGNLYVEGNIETHDAELSENSRQVVTGRQLYRTNERVDKLDNRIKKVGANAAALAALRPGDFNPDDKFSIAAGFGSYRNASAAALGLFYRPNENVILSLGTSFGDGENMVNAGVSVKFGRGKSMAERRKEMADEVSGMRDEMKSQNDRIAELEEMLKKQSELIEKLSKES